MEPTKFIDVHLRPLAGVSIWDLATAVVRQVHGHLMTAPGSVAVAFPGMRDGEMPHPGRTIQVFSESDMHLGTVKGRIEGLRSFAEMLRVDCEAQIVPKDIQKWSAFTRFRIASNRRRVKDTDACLANRCRTRVRDLAEEQTLPTLIWRTGVDKGGVFGISVKRLLRDGGMPNEPGALNGYGLSSAARPFWLPVLV